MRAVCCWLVTLGVLTALPACMPDVDQDPVPAAMEFDPTATPARIPEPISLVINPETGLIDFSVDGLDVPEVCDEESGMAIANCEFYQYLESLDGFPTVLPTSAPATHLLDMATVSVGSTLAVLDATRNKALQASDVVLSFDTTNLLLNIDAPTGWEPGTTYVFGVKGLASGVKAEGGMEVVGGPIFFLLKKDESLMCGAATPDAISEECPYYGLLKEMEMSDADIRSALASLEPIRAQLAQSGLWTVLKDLGGISKEEAAVAWSFPIHSASVIQLDPTKSLVPTVVSATEVRLGFKGTMDAATAKVWTLGKAGNLFALDLTALEAGDLVGGLPKASAAVDGQEIVLTFEADFPEGHTLGLLATTGITNADGKPFVPSPVTVLLKASGPLVDADGKSLVDDVADADAAELESGRSDLALLLDDATFSGLTKLTRKDLVYVYAFDFAKP